MYSADPKSYVFIADPDQAFLESLTVQPVPKAPLPVTAGSLRECQRKVSVKTTQLLGAFINPALGHPAWMTIARDVMTFHPGTPVFLICDTPPVVDEQELANLGVRKIFQKPINLAQMILELQLLPAETEAEAEANTEAPAPPPAPKKPAAPAQDGDHPWEEDTHYIRLASAKLAIRLTLRFDVYVKLGRAHYTKLWNAGDLINNDQLAHQVEAGVREYFIRREDQYACLATCNQAILALLSNPAVPLEIKSNEVRALGAETINILGKQGLESENIQYAVEFVQSASLALAELARSDDHLKKLFLDPRLQNHAISTAMLGALLLNNIGLPRGPTYDKIGLVLLVHNVALWGRSAVLESEEIFRMGAEELDVFTAHPAQGAEILGRSGQFPPALLEAIAQHHVRLDDSGFPSMPAGHPTNRIAELIGVCSDLAHLIARGNAESRSKIFSEFRDEAPRKFSPQIIEAFEKTFLKIF